MRPLALSCAVFVLSAVPARSEVVKYARVNDSVIRARLDRTAKTNQERLNSLTELFHEAGCRDANLQPQVVKGARLSNVICTLPGETDERIVVGAHYDKVDAGMGALDNWSGSAMLVNLYEALSKHPRRHTIVFVGFSDEEKGLVGSRFYVDKMAKEERAKIRATVNMDCLGAGPVSVWAARSDDRLLAALQALERSMKLELRWVNVDQVGDSDSHPFANKKIPVIDFHSLTNENLPLLHSPKDTIDLVDVKHYVPAFHVLANFVAYLDVAMEQILSRKVKFKKR